MDAKASFHVAAMSADPRIMQKEERFELIKKLLKIDERLVLNFEEEVVDLYKTALLRLDKASLKLEWPLRAK